MVPTPAIFSIPETATSLGLAFPATALLIVLPLVVMIAIVCSVWLDDRSSATRPTIVVPDATAIIVAGLRRELERIHEGVASKAVGR